MIGDDHIDAEFPCAPNHFSGANAGVHADNQAHAHGGRAFNHIGPHAVAVLQTVRDVEAGLAARELDRFFQDDYGDCTVDVVIAVNQDFFVGGYGGAKTSERFWHAS